MENEACLAMKSLRFSTINIIMIMIPTTAKREKIISLCFSDPLMSTSE